MGLNKICVTTATYAETSGEVKDTKSPNIMVTMNSNDDIVCYIQDVKMINRLSFMNSEILTANEFNIECTSICDNFDSEGDLLFDDNNIIDKDEHGKLTYIGTNDDTPWLKIYDIKLNKPLISNKAINESLVYMFTSEYNNVKLALDDDMFIVGSIDNLIMIACEIILENDAQKKIKTVVLTSDMTEQFRRNQSID